MWLCWEAQRARASIHVHDVAHALPLRRREVKGAELRRRDAPVPREEEEARVPVRAHVAESEVPAQGWRAQHRADKMLPPFGCDATGVGALHAYTGVAVATGAAIGVRIGAVRGAGKHVPGQLAVSAPVAACSAAIAAAAAAGFIADAPV